MWIVLFLVFVQLIKVVRIKLVVRRGRRMEIWLKRKAKCNGAICGDVLPLRRSMVSDSVKLWGWGRCFRHP